MDVTPPPPKRRRGGGQSAPSPSPVPVHDGGRDREAVDDVDLLSALADDVLGSIITLLPAKDGARTQILSRRFRPLWRSASVPLNLEATIVTPAPAPAGDPQPPTIPPAVVAALMNAPGPARRVSITWLARFDEFPKLDTLLQGLQLHQQGGGRRFPCLDTLKEFELYYKPAPDGRLYYSYCPHPPMASLLRFSRTLRVLTLCSAAQPWWRRYTGYKLAFPAETDAVYRELEFPSLERLTLKHVSISEAVLHGILARCPALQSLVLHKNEGYWRLVIRSPTLRSFGLSDGAAEVVVEDAPMLERLIPRDIGSASLHRIQVVHAPRLKTVGYLCNRISEFEIGTTVLKLMVPPADASSAIRTVKILALDSPLRDLDAVLDLLKCFPCMEKLYMELNGYGESNNVNGKLKNARRSNVPIECLDTHLKMVELRNYRGKKQEVSLIRFFLSNARVLESMKFVVPPQYVHMEHRKWIVKQRKKLLFNIRASQGARFHFEFSHGMSSRVPMEHIHNLAIDDPFGRSSCSCQYDDFK